MSAADQAEQTQIEEIKAAGFWPVQDSHEYLDRVARTADSTVCRMVLLELADRAASPLS